MVPFLLAANPAFVDFMTSLNNHTAAIAFVSLWIYAAIFILRNGFSWPALVGLLAITSLCFLVQKSAWVTLPLTPLVLYFVFVRKRPWILAPVAAGAGLILMAFAVNNQDADHWIRLPSRSRQFLKRNGAERYPPGTLAFSR
jgi:hypothetical protein